MSSANVACDITRQSLSARMLIRLNSAHILVRGMVVREDLCMRRNVDNGSTSVVRADGGCGAGAEVMRASEVVRASS